MMKTAETSSMKDLNGVPLRSVEKPYEDSTFFKESQRVVAFCAEG